MLPRPLAIGLTILIALVWTANVIFGFIDPARHDPTLNAIFGITIGAVYGLTRKENVQAARKKLGRLIEGEDSKKPTRGDDE